MRNMIATELRSMADPALFETGVYYDQVEVEMTIDDGPVSPIAINSSDWLEVGYGVYRLRLPEISPELRRRKMVVVVVTADGCLPSRHSLFIEPVLKC